jgi:hypothetical protein
MISTFSCTHANRDGRPACVFSQFGMVGTISLRASVIERDTVPHTRLYSSLVSTTAVTLRSGERTPSLERCWIIGRGGPLQVDGALRSRENWHG